MASDKGSIGCLLRFRDAHTQVVLGQHLGIFVLRLVAPDDLLPEVHALIAPPLIHRKRLRLEREEQAATTRESGAGGHVPPDDPESLRAAEKRVNAAHCRLNSRVATAASCFVSSDSPNPTSTANVNAEFLIPF